MRDDVVEVRFKPPMMSDTISSNAASCISGGPPFVTRSGWWNRKVASRMAVAAPQQDFSKK